MKELLINLRVTNLETKVEELMTPVPMAVAIPDSPPPLSLSVFKPGFTYNIKDVERNLMNYPVEKMAEYSRWGGIVIACASSQDKAVRKVLVKACSRPGAGFTTKQAIYDKWKQWNIHSNPKYALSFQEKWSKPWIETLIRPLWEEIDDPDAFICNRFYENYTGEFLQWDKKLSHYNQKPKLWKCGLKGDGQGEIYSILNTRLRSSVKVYWANKQKEDKDFYIKKKTSGCPEDELEQIRVELAKNTKFVIGQIKRLSAHTSLSCLSATIFNKLTHSESSIERDTQFNLEIDTNHYVQFRNGAYNLKTGKLEPRTREMYISLCLGYNYRSKKSFQRSWKILRVLKKILPDSVLRNAQLNWRGLCLTGETREQVFMLNLGTGASNGKSTLAKLYAEAFPIYHKAIGNDCFDKNNESGYNKCMSGLAGKPIRLITMEEWGEKSQDVNKIKSTVEGSSITCKPLYERELTMRVQFKLEASSNHNTTVDSMDNGFNRRALLMEYDSKFVDSKEDVDEDNHIYLKDKGVDTLLDSNNMKLAFFHILAPYAKDYYDNGLDLPKEVRSGFATMVNEDDELKDFFDKFESNKYSEIGKNEMLHYFNQYPQETITTKIWKNLKQEFKKRGFNYDPYKFVWDPDTKKQSKGAITGIKYIGGEVVNEVGGEAEVDQLGL